MRLPSYPTGSVTFEFVVITCESNDIQISTISPFYYRGEDVQSFNFDGFSSEDCPYYWEYTLTRVDEDTDADSLT